MTNFRKHIESRHDSLLNKGFDYKNIVLKRTLSSALYLESKRKMILEKLEEPITYIINSIKNIKKSYNWTVPMDYENIN